MIIARQEMKLGGAGGSERVYRELLSLQLGLPGFDEPQNGGDVQMFVDGGIFLEVGLGEFKQGSRGPQTGFFQMHESPGKLDEALIEGMFWPVAVGKPELFEHFMGFEVKSAIEAFKKAEIMGVQILSVAVFDEGGDFGIFFGHLAKVMQMTKGWQ